MAIYFGVIVGGFGGYAATHPNLGWRLTFTACGVFGMLYALPLVFLLRDPAKEEQHLVVPPISPVGAARELFTNRFFLLLVLYFTLPAIAGWVVRDWMPSILKKEFPISEGKAGVAATLYWQVASILGVIAGGWLADRWMRTNERGRIYVSAIGMSLIVPAIYGVGNARSLTIAVAFLALFGLGWGFFDCNNMPILSQIVRPRLRATGYGIMNFVSISFGGLGDWGFGVLRDRQVPLNVIFSGFAGLAIISIVLVLLIRPRPEIITEEQAR
jgi:MFS family permease